MMRAHATGAEERVQEAAVQQPYESKPQLTVSRTKERVQCSAVEDVVVAVVVVEVSVVHSRRTARRARPLLPEVAGRDRPAVDPLSPGLNTAAEE